MTDMYLYGDSSTKVLDTARLEALTAEQKEGRVEIVIDDTHPAFADKDRLTHYKINATDDGIEASNFLTCPELVTFYRTKFAEDLAAIGFTLTENAKMTEITDHLDTQISGAGTIEAKFDILHKFVKAFANLNAAITNGCISQFK